MIKHAVLAAIAAAALGGGVADAQPAPAAAPARTKVGVALGGGSARGIAHVGVLKWLEEHRVPIDVLAGTSMGGLIGGSYATGMSPDEIDAMLQEINWEEMFGSSQFQFSNVRRKRDLRAYPSGLEFGLKRGIVPPPSLNNGQQVELLLSRIAAPYYAIDNFDQLPTPFRCVAVDLTSASPVIMKDGSLARAMRATMSLPLVFPPVSIEPQMLVDGGAMNNIPGDIVRAMGADKVIAVNVGDLSDKTDLDYSLLGLVMETLDAMMRANTKRAVSGADIQINVPLKEYGSLDWRRAPDLIAEGYKAAEAMKDQLLPLAISEEQWQQWHAAREAARRRTLPAPAFVTIVGAASRDADHMRRRMQTFVGTPLDISVLDETLRELGGLDRYETLSWALVDQNGERGLQITARPKSYGPPFMYLGVALENTTGNEFRFGLNGRYLAFDVLGSGTELRIDAAVGSDPSAAIAWYRPIGNTSLFIEPVAGISSTALSVIDDGRTVAQYGRTVMAAGGDVGVGVGRFDEVRVGVRYGWTDAAVRIGDPGLPELDGQNALARALWTHDGQDDPIVPSRGVFSNVTLTHYFDAPNPIEGVAEPRTSDGILQLEGRASWFLSLDPAAKKRVLLGGGFGTSFDDQPFPTEQFSLGGPFRMSAFSIGEQRGDHFMMGAAGYLHQLFRLPDFIGGPIFATTWLEVGSAFNHLEDAEIGVHASGGIIADTILGPLFGGISFGMNGENRYYIGIGKIF